MTDFPTVRVAAVQATPVMLDRDATVEKAVGLIAEASSRGAQLIVLPETFVPIYPGNAWGRKAAAFGGFDDLWDNSLSSKRTTGLEPATFGLGSRRSTS